MGHKILITGCNGLIGSNLIKTAPQGYEVIGIGREQGDLTDSEFLDSLPQVDYLIHAAGYGQPKKFLADPIGTIKLNTSTLIKLFDKCKTLLYLSSSEVYSGAKPPHKETDIGTTLPDHVRACYIEAKRCGEAICNIKGGKVARCSLIYGPCVRTDNVSVLYELINQGLSGGITLKDQGQAKRTYCYVDDACEMLWSILFKGHGTYNVGGTSEVTILELAYKIASILNVPVSLGSTGMPGSPDNVKLDLSRVECEFNKTQFIGIDDGLKRTIEWRKTWQGTNGQ